MLIIIGVIAWLTIRPRASLPGIPPAPGGIPVTPPVLPAPSAPTTLPAPPALSAPTGPIGPSGQQILTLPNGLTGPSSIVSTSSSTGAALPQGSNLIAPNKAYFLTVRNNGLTEYNTMNIPVWSKPALSANAPYTLLLLIDGTLQLVGANNTVAWSSGVPSSGTAPFQLSLDNTGNLSVMDSTGLLVWSNCVDTSNLPAGFTCPATR